MLDKHLLEEEISTRQKLLPEGKQLYAGQIDRMRAKDSGSILPYAESETHSSRHKTLSVTRRRHGEKRSTKSMSVDASKHWLICHVILLMFLSLLLFFPKRRFLH